MIFEPNDEPLWAQIRLNVGAFMQRLFRLGAFAGMTPTEAYLVKCDSDTTTAYDVRSRRGQHTGRVPATAALRVRRDPDPATLTKPLGGLSGQFNASSNRFDPYKNFKFRVKWDGRYVAGVSKVSAFKRTTEVVKHRSGGDPSSSRKSPGRTEFDPITLEQGVTHDVEFERWANKVWNYGAGLGAEVSLKDYKKDILVELYNEAGQLAIAYKVYDCWVSEYQPLPDLDANANAVAIGHIKIENEGWELDASVIEPTPPSFTVPTG